MNHRTLKALQDGRIVTVWRRGCWGKRGIVVWSEYETREIRILLESGKSVLAYASEVAIGDNSKPGAA